MRLIFSSSEALSKYFSAKKSTICFGVQLFLKPLSQTSANNGSKTPVLSMASKGNVIKTLL